MARGDRTGLWRDHSLASALARLKRDSAGHAGSPGCRASAHQGCGGLARLDSLSRCADIAGGGGNSLPSGYRHAAQPASSERTQSGAAAQAPNPAMSLMAPTRSSSTASRSARISAGLLSSFGGGVATVSEKVRASATAGYSFDIEGEHQRIVEGNIGLRVRW